MTPAEVRSMSAPSGDFDGDVRGVGESVEHGRALLRLGHQRLDLLPRCVRVDGERDLDVVVPVADITVGAEDPADVMRALDGRLDREELDAPVFRDRCHPPDQAAREAYDE